jgi:hypothetical protein
MALFIPDISHHQKGIDIEALKNQGCAALLARVGQAAGRRRDGHTYGTTRDREWVRHRDEARRVGLPLVAYWYVGNLVTAADNADLAASWVGDQSIPWMLDHEDASGDISFYRAVVKAFQARGLKVFLGYVPKWYWDAVGQGSLVPGPPIVNSRYSTRSGSPSEIYTAAGGDAGNGWINFGGQQTVLWQFTNKADLAGMRIDCSAFRGDRAQLMQTLGLASPPPSPQPPITLEDEGDEVKTFYIKGDAEGFMEAPHEGTRWGDAVFMVESTVEGLRRRHISPEEWTAAEATGAKVTQLPQAWVDKIPGADGGDVVLWPWENAGGGPVPGEPE